MRHAPDDYTPPLDPLPLFDAWPQRPAAGVAEQAVLAIPGTIEAGYRAWRDTPQGASIYAWIRERALLLAEAGVTRIEIKVLWGQARATFHEPLNNDHAAMVSRDLVRDEPVLRSLFRFRERRAT